MFRMLLATACGLVQADESCAEGTAMLHRRDDDLLASSDADAATIDIDDNRTDAGNSTSTFSQLDLKNQFDNFMAFYEQSPYSLVLKDLNEIQSNCTDKHVVVSGMPRSGSTSLYTIANIMLFFCNRSYTPPKHSFYLDLPEDCDPEANRGSTFCWDRLQGRTMAIVKTHHAIPKQRLPSMDVVLMSHRKPAEAMVSIWNNFYPSCATPPCEAWPAGDREMQRQACLYDKFPAKKVAYDMDFKDLQIHPRTVFVDVAKALGVTRDGRRDGEVSEEMIAQAMKFYNQTTGLIGAAPEKAPLSEILKKSAAAGLWRQNEHNISGAMWVNAGGKIAANPYVEKDGDHYRVKHIFRHLMAWDWCNN